MRPASGTHKRALTRLPSRGRRNPSRGELAERLRFESFLVELSAAFVQVDPEGVESRIDLWLSRVAEFIGVDRSTLWELSPDGETLNRRHSHSATHEHAPIAVPREQFAWLDGQLRSGHVVSWSRCPDDIPEVAAAEREYGLAIGAKSFLGIPIGASRILCVITFVSMRRYRKWPPALIQRLRLVGEVLAGAVVRRQVEASLHSSESRNRAMLRALPDLMFVLDAEGVYLDYQSRDDSELLMAPERFLGRSVGEVLPREVATKFHAAVLQALRSDEVIEVEYTLYIQGEPREYEARLVRRDDGAVVSIVRNMTERNRSERKLRESEERFRGAFENSAIGMALVSPEGRWLQVNPAICRMLGYSEVELRGMTFQALTHPDDLALNLDQLRRAVDGEIDHYEFEKRYIHKDCRTISALLTVSVVRDAQRRPLYFVSQLQDLTERKRAQTEVERLRLELAHFGRLALTGQLTASLAHQLMQPITAARGNAEACQRLIASGRAEPGDTQVILEDILDSCNRAAAVINNVRSLLRKESRPRRQVNLNRLVEEVLRVMHHELILRQVRVVSRLDADVPEINGNSVELQQVILNLLMNGAEAMSQNVAFERQLVISTTRQGQEVEIIVQDRGAGVDPAHLKRMFEPFFTTKPEGMGMGLTICADIVRAHRGHLWAENNSEGGVTVHCTLPL